MALPIFVVSLSLLPGFIFLNLLAFFCLDKYDLFRGFIIALVTAN